MTQPSNGAGNRQPIDFAALARALLDRARDFLDDWFPGGHVEGHEWVGPSRKHGGIGDSLKVNLNNGRWGYFGGGDDDNGPDLISLYAWDRRINNGKAARELMDQMGWRQVQEPAGPVYQDKAVPDVAPTRAAVAAAAAAARGPDAGATEAQPRWRPVLPVPKHAPVPRSFKWGYRNEALGGWTELEAVRTWEYVFEGERFGYVARFERINSAGELTKDTLPYTWCEDTQDPHGACRWHWKQWAAPRPLYVPATLLAADPGRIPVVVVEGEKCAEAGHQLLGHEFDFVCWPGGAKAWALARWSWLMGRTVYLWPDADAKRVNLTRPEREAGVDPATKPMLPLAKQPGYKAMVGIGTLLLAEHGCTVHMCRMKEPGTQPDGWDIADAIAAGWTADQVRDHIRAALPFVAPDDAARAAAGVSTPTRAPAGEGAGSPAGDASADDGQAWRRHLMTSATTGAVKSVRENIVMALDGWPERGVKGIPECADLIRYNEFTNNIEKARATPWGTPAGDWLEADELLMGDWLVREWYMPSMARQALEEAVVVVARRHSCHPLRERMVGLRGRWDKQPRLDGWLRRVCLEEDEWDLREPLHQYLTLAGRWFIMGMVARLLPEVRRGPLILQGPGTKFDTMLVLESPQGWGKSSLAKLLGGEYFADTGLDLQNKDSLMNIQGISVYEWGELQDLSRHEVGQVKRFISSPVDRFRATFDKRPAKYPRQVVFIGTTNDAHYLTDSTGNRRFWPVQVTRQPDLVWLEEHLEQMLAEAVERVEARERFWPTRDEQQRLFTPQQQARTVESALDSAIRTYLYDDTQRTPIGEENRKGTLINDIQMQALLKAIGYSIDKQTDAVVKKAGSVMHALGWTIRRTSEPGRPRVYQRPDAAQWAARGLPSNDQGGSPESTPATQGDNPQGPDDDMPF